MAETLGKLKTDLGERSTYDAASQCSRCGYCEQACPTYVATGEESKSPRGRNQLVRLMLEGKLKDKASAAEALATCLLCGACQTACYAHVSVPDIVLEGRRLIGEERHWLMDKAIRLLVDKPKLFDLLLKLAHLGKSLGLNVLFRRFLPPGLARADAEVESAPLTFAKDLIPVEAGAKWQYFAACGTNYLFPEVAQDTLEAVPGVGSLLPAGCCGLVAFNYGNLEDARILARRVVAQAAKTSGDIVVDCSSCAAHLKSYPQLLPDEASVAAFAKRVKDVLEVLPPVKATHVETVHESCRACHGQGVRPKVSGHAPLTEADVCCGGAGAFSFTQPELSEEILKRKIENVKATGAKVVAASSTSCLLQLARGLRKYYPDCRVVHISRLAREENGTTTGA
jgi:glycolate oxidase iron-sulfur subunit